ncbi:hypothetical protein BH10CHL1_BH10CHL1_31330 [soil metagenome]
MLGALYFQPRASGLLNFIVGFYAWVEPSNYNQLSR